MEGQAFGYALSADGDLLLVGDPYDDSCLGTDSGSAYMYAHEDGSWQLEEKICAAGDRPRLAFGTSLSLEGDRAIISSCAQYGEFLGSVSVHQKDAAGSWPRKLVIEAVDGEQEDLFGQSTALSGYEVFVGAPSRTTEDDESLGAVYIYDVSCSDEAVCPSGLCVDGVCCDGECGGGDHLDCEACSVVAGASQNGTCEPLDGTSCDFSGNGHLDGRCVQGECLELSPDDEDTDSDDYYDSSDDDDDSDGGFYPSCLCGFVGGEGHMISLLAVLDLFIAR